MQVCWLGPLEVRNGPAGGGQAIVIPGQRLRLLLGRLALHPGTWVSADALIGTVWGEDQPADPLNSLQSLVSRLRRTLGHPELVEQSPGGYRLTLSADDVDGTRFARLVAEASRLIDGGRDAEAGHAVDEALALWRGDPLPDDTSLEADAVRASLDDLRLQALRDRARLAVRAGRAADVVAELDELAGAFPLREDLVPTLMDALVAAGRPAEALAAFERARTTLAETLGTDPSPALREKHLEVLRLADRPTAPATNLRATLTSFVGRDDDVRAVRARLGQARLVTVVGAGGSGKTRLAQEVARGFLTDDPADSRGDLGLAFPDGVWLVELAPVTESGGVAQAILDALGVRDVALPDGLGERRYREARQRMTELLGTARMLLVLDNCEHLVDVVADLVEELLGRCPGVRVLATSREPLGVAGEVLQPLGPLPVPPEGADPTELANNPALRLLMDRARAVDPTVEIDAAAVEIVRRLDGLPLAIELAAARLRALSTAEVAERLADRFRLLTGGRRTATPRHRTLRAVVEWSWDLLSDIEREVAEHVSVFAAGATPEGAAAVSPSWRDGQPDADIVDVLQALVDKSLLIVDRTPIGTRFRMLETLREYGAERLAERGQLLLARAAHAAHLSRLVADADALLRGPRQLEALRVLDTEHEDVLGALRYLGDSGNAASALDLAVHLAWYWMVRENGQEARRWLQVALDVPGAGASPLAPLARGALTVLAMSTGDTPTGPAVAGIPAIAEDILSTPPGHPLAAILPPLLLMFADRREASGAALRPLLAHPDAWVRAVARMMRLAVAENEGDVGTMRADVDASVADWEALGDGWGIAGALNVRAQLRTMDGDLPGAAEDLDRALRSITELGSTNDHVMIMMRLADLRLRNGRADEARTLLESMAAVPSYGMGDVLRKILVTTATASIALYEDDEPGIARAYDEIRALLEAVGPPSLFQAHAGAVGEGVAALLAVRLGRLGPALQHLRAGYEQAELTHDRPIMAMVAVAVAHWLEAIGSAADAARMLGIAAGLRGADDATNPAVAGLTARLRGRLGAEFDVRYDDGLVLGPADAAAQVDPARYEAAADALA